MGVAPGLQSNQFSSSILSDLRSRDHIPRKKAMQELRDFVNSLANDAYSSNMRVLHDVKRKISDLPNSSEATDKLAGAAALEITIPLFVDEDSATLTRYNYTLQRLLQVNDILVVQHAVKATVNLINISGALAPSLLEMIITNALEWLQGDRTDTRRHAAVLLIRELASQMPNSVYSYVNQALEAMWGPLRDSKSSVRQVASEALGALLEIIEERETPFRLPQLSTLYEEAQKGVKMGTLECLHSSLLVFQQLLRHSGMFMSTHYPEVALLVCKLKDHRDFLIRQAAVTLVEILAEYSPSDFRRPLEIVTSTTSIGGVVKESPMEHYVPYLLTLLKKEKERALAYTILGKIALVVRNDFKPYVQPTLQQIKESLANKTKYRITTDVEAAIMQCLSHFAEALGPVLTKYLHDSLDLLFLSGLNPSLKRTLTNIAKNVSQLLPAVQSKLLDELSLILAGQPYVAPGVYLPTATSMSTSAIVTGTTTATAAALTSSGSTGGTIPATATSATGHSVQDHQDPALLILALQTLGEFNFQSHNLTEFVRDYVLDYLDSDNQEVRIATAVAVNRVFDKDKICQQRSQHSVEIVNETLQYLLSVAIADASHQVRMATLQTLSPSFDQQLSNSNNVRAFSLALNDEALDIRLAAIAVLGRLIPLNPAQVLPFLRRTLLQVLTELECASLSRVKEECCRVIYQLALHAQQWIRAYVVPIYRGLFSKIRDSTSGVSIAALQAMSEITRAGGEDLSLHLSELVPVIIDILQDPVPSPRRLHALRTLGNLGTYAGVVITPYTEYPQLMGTLLSFLKDDKDPVVRRETFRVMGTLGAVDPYQYRSAIRGVTDNTPPTAADDLDVPISSVYVEDYDIRISIAALVRILADANLAAHHSSTIQAIMHLFTTLGNRCFRYLPKIVPAFTHEMKNCPASVLDFYFEQLSILVIICRQNIREYLDLLLELVDQHWQAGPNIQLTIVGLIESMSLALDGDFRERLPHVLPRMLEALDTDTSDRRSLTVKILHAIATFGTNVEEYIHIIVPVFIRVLDHTDIPAAVKCKTLYTQCVIAQTVSSRGFASRLIHCVMRLLASNAPVNQDQGLQAAAMDTLCVLMCQLQYDYLSFVASINKIMRRQKIHHSRYDLLLNTLLNNDPLPKSFAISNMEPLVRKLPAETLVLDGGTGPKKLDINQAVLQDRCNTVPWSTREDWLSWINRFNLMLLEESPSRALRACSSLASQYPPLAKDLFNVGFVTMWSECAEPDQDLLVQAMRNALVNKDVPNEILQTVLNLAEFMEHDEKAIQIDIRTLAAYASSCNAYAKALHYSELTFSAAANANNLNALIRAYTQLNQYDSAAGLVKYAAQILPDLEMRNAWYERLQRWDEALAFYQEQETLNPDDTQLTVAKMRCLHALCEWDQLTALVDDVWDRVEDDQRHHVALLAAGAAWGSGELDRIDQYINLIKKESSDQYFFKAVLAVHRNESTARDLIQKTRDLLDTEISFPTDGYGRSYSSIVRIQMLSEFEEILDYKQYADQPKRQEVIRNTWNKRLQGVSKDVEVWQKLLRVRSSVLPPDEDMEVWLQFAELSREGGQLNFAEQTIASIVKCDPLQLHVDVIHMAPSEVVYAYLEVLWAKDEMRNQVYDFLDNYVHHLRYQLGIELNQGDGRIAPHPVDPLGYPLPDKGGDVGAILARFYMKKGEWYGELREARDKTYYEHVTECYRLAAEMDQQWYTAWHAWAQVNYEAVQTAEKEHQPLTAELLVTYIVPAVDGYTKSIALSSGNTLQDTLRLLALMFNYGHQQEVCLALNRGLHEVPVQTWLQVIPQLIARIHIRYENVRHLIQHILALLGKEYPQSLLFSLIVASKSESQSRQKIAMEVMDKMKLHDEQLVEEAQMVGAELIRAAMLWSEMWQSAIEEASRQYYTYHNLQGMYDVLKHNYQLIQKGPSTIKETQFLQTFGRELKEAWDLVQQYRQTLDLNILNQAWEIYGQLFKKFEKLSPKSPSLSLEQAAPQLLNCHDMQLMVPGWFHPNKPLVRISGFDPHLHVYPTKQKPRRIHIYGSDGRTYKFLDKGHEDLRQDERVMQLFELVNNLLAADAETFKRHLDIERYPVVPLSPNTGLIGWVEDSDTLHALIREYRDMRDTTLGIEYRIIQVMAPNFDNLPALQKVEIFEAALRQTHGQDLYKVLWLKSRNSEEWLERRTCYTRSLGVMSIVGYILGLGDRHPSNLMLHRKTGKVVHIDFGDCFEVATQRDRFPETVPFRLTRMLILAMEISGIEGSFRTTCEHVMRVVRLNRDSLMAVLEAFVYDPLINWRLTPPKTGALYTEGELGPRRVSQHREDNMVRDEENQTFAEQTNARAVEVMTRVSNKLIGRDFHPQQVLPVNAQVDKLIKQATSSENLSQLFVGWCSFW